MLADRRLPKYAADVVVSRFLDEAKAAAKHFADEGASPTTALRILSAHDATRTTASNDSISVVSRFRSLPLCGHDGAVCLKRAAGTFSFEGEGEAEGERESTRTRSSSRDRVHSREPRHS